MPDKLKPYDVVIYRPNCKPLYWVRYGFSTAHCMAVTKGILDREYPDGDYTFSVLIHVCAPKCEHCSRCDYIVLGTGENAEIVRRDAYESIPTVEL